MDAPTKVKEVIPVKIEDDSILRLSGNALLIVGCRVAPKGAEATLGRSEY